MGGESSAFCPRYRVTPPIERDAAVLAVGRAAAASGLGCQGPFSRRKARCGQCLSCRLATKQGVRIQGGGELFVCSCDCQQNSTATLIAHPLPSLVLSKVPTGCCAEMRADLYAFAGEPKLPCRDQSCPGAHEGVHYEFVRLQTGQSQAALSQCNREGRRAEVPISAALRCLVGDMPGASATM